MTPSNRRQGRAAASIARRLRRAAASQYGDATLPEEERLAAMLARWIVSERPALINARELRRTLRLPDLRAANNLQKAIDALAEFGWVQRAGGRQGDTKGRQRGDYTVSPRLFEVGQ